MLADNRNRNKRFIKCMYYYCSRKFLLEIIQRYTFRTAFKVYCIFQNNQLSDLTLGGITIIIHLNIKHHLNLIK